MESETRRTFLFNAATTVAAGLATGCRRRGPKAGDWVGGKEEEEVAPGEDLMREHGVLNRLLLVYEEVGRRIQGRRSYPADVVTRSGDIVRRFIEGYHEKLEEDQLFPRFEKAGRLVDLVGVLRTQHQRGRSLTAEILQWGGAPLTRSTRERLIDAFRLFIRMYRPHEAREDTVLFPAFHQLVSQKEYESLGDVFEDMEHELFGARGFDGIVEEVAQIEQALGIYELSQFTPL